MRGVYRAKITAQRILRFLATLPLRILGSEDQSRIVEHFFASIVTTIEVNNNVLRFMAATPILQWRARTALSKEPDTTSWIDEFGPNDILWDIGANVGVFSVYAAKLRGVGVLAFEPAADNYMVLCRNVEINELARRVIPYCLAFAKKSSLGVLNSNSSAIGSSLRQFGDPGVTSQYWPTEIGSHAQGMIGFSIDDFIRQFNPTFPTHIKIDVDGLEIDILRGAVATLSDDRMRSIMVELNVGNDVERNEGVALLSSAGFELVSQGDIQESAGVRVANHFFAKKQEDDVTETGVGV